MNKPGNSLKSEIDRAIAMSLLLGPACLRDERIGDQVRRYRESILQTDAMMLEMGVVEACSRCANSKGSCCFTEMGESYGFLQLFVNLLLGSTLPEQADFSGTCHFVGNRGCKLQARHSFCLNYFCPDLKELLGEQEIMKIQRKVGEQLLIGWELERTLSGWLTDANRHD
ncbi:MAG: hypothetical protein AB9866_28975 [Syntrophobacteraceae bacterium]